MAIKEVLDTIMEQPIEEPMRNKWRKAETLSLASRKAQREQGYFLLFSHIGEAVYLPAHLLRMIIIFVM